MTSPRVVLIDIETSPNRGWSWGGKYDQNIIRWDKEWELLSFAHKELNKGKTTCVARPDFNDESDYDLTAAAWEVCNEADILIGHNIDKFDSRKLRAKWIEHGFNPPKPYRTIDTVKIARSQFAFNSNSLNDLAFTLKLGRKVHTGGVDLWFKCMEGDPKAWARMRRYNAFDVVLLEKVYNRLAAWFPNHESSSLR